MKSSGMRTAGRLVACCLSFMLATPAFARGGFGGGGMRGGGGFGGMRGGGGFGGMRGGGGFGGMRDGGFGGRAPSSNFGGGFSSPGRTSFGDRGGGFAGRDGFAGDGGFSNRPGFGGDGGFGNRQGFGGNRPNQPISTRPNRPGNFPTDGGFGKLGNWKNSNWGHNNFRNFDNRNFNSNNIRNSFNQYNQYNFNRWGGYGYGHAGWWGYPGGWYCPGWSSAMAWTCMGMTSLMGFLGIAALASSGNGSRNNNSAPSVTNVTYQGGNVYVDGSLAGTADDYYQQAQGLAAAGINYASTAEQDSDYSTGPDQWQPLGVFSLAQQGQTQSSMLLQLAINRDGIVRGNYFNQLTNESSEVYGSLDKQTQRVSWTLGQNSSTVFDTALSDLTKDDAPVLVHYGPTNTQSMMLVRLQQPPQQQAPAADPSGWQAG